MRIQSVIDRALRDPVYAAGLAAKARTASASRSDAASGQDALGALLAEFADGPEELARLRAAPTFDGGDGTTTATSSMTTMTITTTTTLPCLTTTTTSTTSVTTTTTDAVVLEA